MWKNNTINVGTLIEGDKCRVKFEYTGECIPVSVQVHPSCGCTNSKWLQEDMTLHVGYTARRLPKHLRQRQIDIKKSIKMVYICDGKEKSDVLHITGTVVKKI